MTVWKYIFGGILLFTTGCSTTPPKADTNTQKDLAIAPQFTPVPGRVSLPDRTVFLQKDPRWGSDRLGKTTDTMETDGCLVSATAMVLGNLGFETDPGDLNKRLTQVDGYTPQGWLIWSAIDKVTDGEATARYYDEVSTEIIDGCMADGYYPLARFILPSGRSHWAMIVRRSQFGFHMRDPLHPSDQPLIFPQGVEAFKAVRCVGRA